MTKIDEIEQEAGLENRDQKDAISEEISPEDEKQPNTPTPTLIKKMTAVELREGLSKLSLSSKGNKKKIKNRLRKAISDSNLTNIHAKIPTQEEGSEEKPNRQQAKSCKFDYLLIVDFEATCIEERLVEFPHEIIEFPVVLLNTKT
eukprot:Sdes_comp10762_c0_seq1m2435